MTDQPTTPPARYQVTALGQWMCRDCGSLVDYLDGRDIHDQWHKEQPRIAINAAAISDAVHRGKRRR